MTTSDIVAEIKRRLLALAPEELELHDDSSRHAGHAGAAGGGGHYDLRIVSARFQGLNRLARHRLVYAELAPLMQQRIHALSIIALTPSEAATEPHGQTSE